MSISQWSIFQTKLHACGHHGESWTKKPLKGDSRGSGLISPLHNAEKASTGSNIGSKNLKETFYFQMCFLDNS